MAESHDQRWDTIARQWLIDSFVPAHIVRRYAPRLAQQLHDTAAEFSVNELPSLERDAEDAASDADWQARLDEVRGK